MTCSLSSSLLGVLALTLVVLQGVLAFIEPRLYLILTENNRFLSMSLFVLWIDDFQAKLGKSDKSQAAIPSSPVTASSPMALSRGMMECHVGASNLGREFSRWHFLFTIGTTNKDLLFTENQDEYPPVLLKAASDSEFQRWRFVPVEGALGRLYGKSRFNLQCAM
ncbi:hypothetical protein BGZ95_005715 [Linnemannia exigua]|uniref:Uncharacterized protein n=1 Tax=Linnemannia exigua TaxID=604196 RepID=A0AAD4D1M8_9FUNG|nr:hypothetical protein BGZ95_005715 [Linnemannia exigua]